MRIGSPRFRAKHFLISDPPASGNADAVILNMRTGTYLQLDSTGALLLTELAQRGVHDTVNGLADRIAGGPSEASERVNELIGLLYQRAGSTQARRSLTRGVAAKDWREFRKLSRGAKITVIEAFVLISCIEIALRILPIDTTARIFRVPLATRAEPQVEALRELDAGSLTGRERFRRAGVEWTLTHWIFDGTCLRRSLATGWFLRGRRPQLHIGRFDEGEVLAHAWLVLDDHTLDGMDGVRGFVRLTDRSRGPERG